MHAERCAVFQAHHRPETKTRLTLGRWRGFALDKAERRGARLGHCSVRSEVLICGLG
jgi:hypothetical protein